MGEGLAARAAELYESGDHEELVALALESWPSTGPLPSGAAELCRFASVASWDMAGSEEPDAARHRALADLLRARALTAAIIEDDRKAAAGLLLQAFFALVEQHQGDTARQVLEEWRRLLPEEVPGDAPSPFARMYFEKRGHSFLVESRYEEAVAEYELAETRSADGTRGQLKVRGALALSRYLADPADRARAAASRTLLDEVAQQSETRGFPDVAAAASTARAVVESGGREGWIPFEVT